MASSELLNEFSKARQMDQKAFLAITAMLNSFPQQAATDSETLLKTYSAVLRDISSQAITETAQRFVTGDIAKQSKTFPPSVAEFVQEARLIEEILPYRGRQSLPPPNRDTYFRRDDKPTRIRMGFKMSVLSASFAVKDGADMVAQANKGGLEHLIALGQQWGVPVPEELWAQLKTAA